MEHRIFGTSITEIHRLYVAKVERKGHAREEVDQVICWLTGHTPDSLQATLDEQLTLAEFFARAPAMNPNVDLIKGLVCGIRVEEVANPLMQQIRWMDKLADEVARGKKMTSILRTR